jgi:ubiquinone/menaquinone biosynthesis C-methylase UbiE
MLNHKKIYFKNRKIYQNKDLIKIIYNNYYKTIKKNIYISNKNKILEIGSGGGNIKKVIKECITSDQFKNENNDNIDRIENIYKINFKKNSISNIILIDVFHHLQFPSLALQEIHRVLIKNGRIIMMEPAMGFIPRIVYKIFHYEPNGFNLKINWNDTPKRIPSLNQYFAAQSLPWRAFFLRELNLKSKYKIKLVKPFSDFAFLLSGGYSYNAFYPKFLYSFIKLIDKILSNISIKIFSARMLIVLEKN